MRNLSVFLFILTSAFASGCLRGSYLKRGEDAMAAGRNQEAEIFFRKEVQSHPRSARGHYDLAQVLLKEGNVQVAASELAKSLDLDPSNAGAQTMHARLLLAAGQVDKAEAEIRDVLKRDPKSRDAELLLGDVFIVRGKLEDARKQFQQTIADHPKDPAGYVAMAGLLERLGLSDEALQYFDHAISVDPKRIGSYLTKAQYLLALKKPAEAASVLQAALRVDPKAEDARLALADALLAGHHAKEATAIFRDMASKGDRQGIACGRLVVTELDDKQFEAASADLKLPTDPSAYEAPDYLYAKGRVLIVQRHFHKAIALLQELTRVRPKFAPGFYYLATAYLAAGQYGDANSALLTAEQLAPSVTAIEMLLASLAVSRGEYPTAIDHLRRVLAQDDKNLSAYILMGDALLAEKRPDEAAQEYRKAGQIDPKSPIVYQRLGRAAMARNDLKTAIDEYETALRLKGSLVDVSEELTVAIWKAKGPQAALDRLRKQVELNPKDPYFHTLLGLYLLQDHQYAPAIPEFQTAIAQQPRLVQAYYGLAQAYIRSGKTEEAVKDFEEAVKRNPRYVAGLMALGQLADTRGDRKGAIGYYQQVLKLDPNFAPAANNLAWDYAEDKTNLDQALDLAQRARQLMPKDPDVADTLGYVMLVRGVSASALPLFREGAERLPNSEHIRYHLGLALLALNQPKEAATELNAALKLNPTPADAKEINAALARANQQLQHQQPQ